MKKVLFVMMLLLVSVPLMAEYKLGVCVEGYYFMESPNDDLVEPESYFGEVSAAAWIDGDLGDGITSKLKLNVAEAKSDGMSSTSDLAVEELWVAKKGPFGQDALGFKFGKAEFPGNLDFDKGVTHAITNMYELDYTWGFNVNYSLGDTLGVINLTTFEGQGGLDTVTLEDADTGLFNSIALQWDTQADAFGVAGLRLVVAYIMMPNGADESGSIISVGATYGLMENALTLALEIDMETWLMSDEDGSTLIAIGADYKISDEYRVGLSYETMSFGNSAIDDVIGRMGIYAYWTIAPDVALALEYSSTDNSEDDTFGGSLIAIGVKSTLCN